jgi:hypothetical protein
MVENFFPEGLIDKSPAIIGGAFNKGFPPGESD